MILKRMMRMQVCPRTHDGWQNYHNGVTIAFHPSDHRDDDNNGQYLFFVNTITLNIYYTEKNAENDKL